MEITIGSLFSGIAGLELGLEMEIPGARVIWQAESNPNALRVLQEVHPSARRYRDVGEVDEHAERPTILCGGFPCQDISLAGAGAGITGPKSGLWAEFARIIRDLRPDLVFVENVAAILGRGLDRVLRDLAALGYDAEWETFLAADVGAPHRRDRLFLLAYTDRKRIRQLAERDQRGGRGERAPERGDAEPLHDREALAEPHGGGRAPRPGAPTGDEERAEPGDSDDAAGVLPDAGGERREGVRVGESPRARGPDVAELRKEELADADGQLLDGRKRQSRRRSRGGTPTDRDGTSDDIGPVADAVRGGQRAGERDLRAGQPDADGRGEGEPLADADGIGFGLVRSGGVFDGERAPHGDDVDRRDRAGALPRHRFPPGPSAIAGWDGPQPAIRRGDDGVPGRSHRLRLLGNAVVPQQAALAFRTLITRAAS